MKTKTKKKEVKKAIQPKKEYGAVKKKEYKQDQPAKIRKPEISNPEDTVSISLRRGDIDLLQRKCANPALAEYLRTMLEVTERQKEVIEEARQTIQGDKI